MREKADLAYKLEPRKIKNKNRLKFIKNYVNGFFFRMKTEKFVSDKKKNDEAVKGVVPPGAPAREKSSSSSASAAARWQSMRSISGLGGNKAMMS